MKRKSKRIISFALMLMLALMSCVFPGMQMQPYAEERMGDGVLLAPPEAGSVLTETEAVMPETENPAEKPENIAAELGDAVWEPEREAESAAEQGVESAESDTVVEEQGFELWNESLPLSLLPSTVVSVSIAPCVPSDSVLK